MKNLKSLSVLFLILIFSSFSNTILAQPAQGNIFVMTNFERAFPDDGTTRELDSLASLYLNKTFGSDNQYVVSAKFVRHWWGHDNRDFIAIMEVKNWDDIIKANQRSNELFEKAWSTKESRDAFNKAYNKYFTGKHSDEIYREVVAP